MTTIREIAATAGVSIGTVSHVLNHPNRVADETRKRMQQAMLQVGWQPNRAAQQLWLPQLTVTQPDAEQLSSASFGDEESHTDQPS